MPHIWQTVIFTPLSASFSTSLHAFAVIFRVLYQVEFGVQPTLSLLAATSSYGKATVCWVCTVCTISYFSYELVRKSKNCLRFLAELELSFNLIYLLIKTDANCPNAHVKTYWGGVTAQVPISRRNRSFPSIKLPVRSGSSPELA